jgi:hypothetical protein
MPQRGLQSLQGAPNRPYPLYTINAGCDIWLELQFLDRNNAVIAPTALSYQVDDLTACTNVLGLTNVTIVANQTAYEIRIPGALNNISAQVDSSENFQVVVNATFADGSMQSQVFVYEVVAINVPG